MPCIFDILSFTCKSKTGDTIHKTQKRISKKNYFREIFRKSEYSPDITEVKTDDLNPKLPLEELKMVIANKKICLPTYKNIQEKNVDSTATVQKEQIKNNLQIQIDSTKCELPNADKLLNESSKKVFSHKLLNLFRKRKRLYEEPTCQNTFKHTDKHFVSPNIDPTSKFPIIDVIINKNLLQKSPNISTHLSPKPQTPLSTFKGSKPSNKPPNLPRCQLSSQLNMGEDKTQTLDNTYDMPLYQEPQPNTKSKYHFYDNNEPTYNEEHYDLPWDLTAKHLPMVHNCPIPIPPATGGVDERPCTEYNEPWSQLLPLEVSSVVNSGETCCKTPKGPKYLALPQPNTCFKHTSPPTVRSSIHSKIKLFESQVSSNNHQHPASTFYSKHTNSLACRRRTCLNVRSDARGGPLSLTIYPAKTARASPSRKQQGFVMTRSLDQGAMKNLL